MASMWALEEILAADGVKGNGDDGQSWSGTDAKGRKVGFKLSVAPSGDLDDASNWRDAGRKGVDLTGTIAVGGGKGKRTKKNLRGAAGMSVVSMLLNLSRPAESDDDDTDVDQDAEKAHA